MSGPERLVAPAKLTVSLRVTGRRPDGYHELVSEMVSVDLADELVVDRGGDGLEIGAGEGIDATALSDGPDNLVRRALEVVGRRARVALTKRIPVGAGLGGGSSDAAAILRWAGCADPSVAAGLGADVPFCVEGGRALVTGLGEQVQPLPFEPRTFVLLLVPLPVPTAAVYRAWDELPADHRHHHEAGAGPNDLTAAALAVEPRLARWRDAFAEVAGVPPTLAGSGSTWFVPGSAPGFVPGPATGSVPADVLVGAQGEAGLFRCDGATGRLVTVRTVPARWSGGPGDVLTR